MSKTKQIHVAMFPWFAFGHFNSYLHLSNKLAERGHKVSFFLPKSAQPKIEKLSHHPHLIHFFPLTVPQLQGLPPGAEIASDVPVPLHNLLCTAYDHTRDQVEQLLVTLRPDFVFTDRAFWLPSLARNLNLNFKTIHFISVSAATVANGLVPSKKLSPDVTPEEQVELQPEYPSQKVFLRHNEIEASKFPVGGSGGGVSFHERLKTLGKECDAIAFRTCLEVEGPFCDYIAKRQTKPVLVMGTVLPETKSTDDDQVEENLTNWLGKFEKGSLVYCAFGTQTTLQKDQFQEMLLGFELSGRPFLAALSPPEGNETVGEALPEGFEERVEGRGWVYAGWAPQREILEHPSVGCFVSHCGANSMWESLLSDCQIVCVPYLRDQIINTRLLVEELKVAVEVERTGEKRWVSKKSLSRAIELVMDKSSEVACEMKSNHANLRNLISSKSLQEEYMDSFVQNLQEL